MASSQVWGSFSVSSYIMLQNDVNLLKLARSFRPSFNPIVYKTLGREVPDYSVDRSASLSPAVSYLACRPWTMGTLHLVP